MFLQIVFFEIKYRLQRPATYIYFLILFGFSFMIMALPDASVSEAGEQLHKNSPYVISQLISSFILFASIILAGVMGVPVYREFDHNFNEIAFTLPVKKWEYLLGKFTGSYIIAVIIYLGIVLGFMVGTFMPWMDEADLGPFLLEAYINPIFVFVLPNVFILGIIFFTVGTLTRSQLAIYAQGLVFIVIYYALSTLMKDVDTNPSNSLFDPFGSIAASFETKYWTTYEKNTLLLPFAGYVMLNRVIWLAISTIIGISCYLFFSPSNEKRFRFRKKTQVPVDDLLGRSGIVIPQVVADFSLKAQIYQWWYFSTFQFKKIIRAIPFWIMLACGLGLLLLGRFGVSMLGATSLPVTYMLLDMLSGMFLVFAVIIVAVYTGELIWKDIDVKVAPIFDSTPVSDNLIVLSRFSAMILVELFIILMIMLCGIGIQISEGFYHFQIAVYLKVLLLHVFPYLLIFTFLVFLIHTLINNKFVGHTLVIVFFLLQIFSGQLGMDHVLTQYGNSIEKSYSDMNGFQNFVFPTLIVDLYWFFLGAVFLILSILLIKRGNSLNYLDRLDNARVSLKKSRAKFLIPSFLILFIATGAFIYYNTNVLNTYRNKKANREFQAEYENTYSKYADYPKPRILDVKTKVDLFPSELRLESRGEYLLTNKNDVPLDSIHVRTNPWISINKLKFNIAAELVDSSMEHGYFIYKPKVPVQPGDTFQLYYDFTFQERGFHRWGHSTSLVANGTFLHNEFMPDFGYNESGELRDKKERKKIGLPEKLFEADELTDSSKYGNTYIGGNADRVNFECIISTEPDQTAISVGTLVDEWVDNDRRYFKYKMDEPVWNFYSFYSAEYKKYEEEYKGITLAIYYHKTHDFNLETMVKAMKKTIDFCNANYYPFQHDALRIVEIPRYSSYAQSFPGTIAFSEGLGFILDVDEKNDIDVPFFVTAHETAHQWWGHQVCAAPVKGFTLMVESLAEYTAMMVMLEELGEKQANKFLKYELDRYMLMRAAEKKKEVPLYLVDDQQYLSYQKGCLAFYNLMDNIGADSLHAALSRFIETYQYKGPPYPTSMDLIKFVEEVVPDSSKYLVDNWFMKIILFSNRADSVQYSESENGKFNVELYTTSKKYQADSLGKQEALVLSDWLDIGVFAESSEGEDSLIYLEKVLVTEGKNHFSIEVDTKPTKAGIDPMLKQVDRNLLDNSKTAKKI